MSLLEKIKQIKLKDFRVPLAGIPALVGSMYGGVLAGRLASNYFTNPETIGTFQVAGNFIGGGIIFFPVYAYDCYARYKDVETSRFFKDQAKLGTVIALGTAINVAKPVVCGQLMRRGLDPDSASVYFDIGAESVRLVFNNFTYFNNILSLKLKAKSTKQ